MKNIVPAATAAIVTAGTAFADPLEGAWRTTTDDNDNSDLIQVAPCDAMLWGTLVKSYDGSGAEVVSANIGRQIISETEAAGDGNYRGKVWSPHRDKTYNSRLVLSGDTWSLSGRVLGICRDGGTWSRAN